MVGLFLPVLCSFNYTTYTSPNLYTNGNQLTFSINSNDLTNYGSFNTDVIDSFNTFNMDFGYLEFERSADNVDNEIKFQVDLYKNNVVIASSYQIFSDNDYNIYNNLFFISESVNISISYESYTDLLGDYVLNAYFESDYQPDGLQRHFYNNAKGNYYNSLDINGAFNNGYNAGYSQGQKDLQSTIDNLQNMYDNLNTSYQELQRLYNNYINGNVTLDSLIWNIATTPFETFKTIWDVDILGVNLGSLCVGLMFVGIALYIWRKFI